jgi:hypothetical protein
MHVWAAKGARARSSRSFATSDLLVARDGDESVVLHLPSGTYLRLDVTATEILDLVQAEGRSGAAAALARRYDLNTGVATADVSSVLDRIGDARASGEKTMRRPGIQGGAKVLRQWIRLPVRAKLAVTVTSGLVVAVEVALRLFPIDAIARRIGAPIDDDGTLTPGAAELDLTKLSDRDQVLFAAADWTLTRWVFDATCLRRALLYGWLLRRHGPRLRIGLMKDGDALAHAWLEVDGCTLGALGDVGDFSRMPSSAPPGG